LGGDVFSASEASAQAKLAAEAIATNRQKQQKFLITKMPRHPQEKSLAANRGVSYLTSDVGKYIRC
jgi:hypothetical protein